MWIRLTVDDKRVVQEAEASTEAGPFGRRFSKLDSHAPGEWWKTGRKKGPRLMVPRDQVLAFALYTHDRGVFKLTETIAAQRLTVMEDVIMGGHSVMPYHTPIEYVRI
mgnify:CR=1 FL=1